MRIRTIKPEWLDDERLVLASPEARVLSVALILLADDYGNGRANRMILSARVFPGSRDPRETLANALDSLETAGFVDLYEVDGQSYFAIRNWTKHQKVDHPGKPQVPGKPAVYVPSRESRETLAKVPESLALDQDQEGTRKGPGEEARVASRAFGWSDITETYSRLRSEAWERKTGNPGGRWKPGTKDHGGISSALELFRDEPDPQAALDDSIRGYLADPWAIERDWPFSAWARDPGRYRGKAPIKASEQVTEGNPALERFEAAKRRLDACKDPEQKGALLRDFYDAQHALARARVRGAA